MDMPILPGREAFVEMAKQGNLIPIYAEILADVETPVSAYLKLAGQGDRFLLESVEHGERFSRYSFVGVNPAVTFHAKDGEITVNDHGEVRKVKCDTDPLAELEKLMAAYRPVSVPPEMPPFYGGAVGALSYEIVRYFEKTVPVAAKDDLQFPDAYFVITDTLLVFDHLTRRLKIVANAFVRGDASAAYDSACEKIRSILEQLDEPLSTKHLSCSLPFDELKPDTNMSRESYLDMAANMKEYIASGDIFQVVPSQRFQVPFDGRPIDLYRVLRSVNPSPYMFCLEFSDFALVGSSPEVHVRCEQGKISVRPIAGTRPRREDPMEDVAMEKELLADEKERAEHVMLVDLARNDVGRVCEFHTVSVPEFMVIERYSHVMHIVSYVQGQLVEGKNAFDVMRATFPAGTVSGAPKVRAMQIIAEQEPTRRGSYAGAVGYFSFSGNLDSCIAIRTMLLKNGTAYLQAGGGLVADSTPEGEYQESISKARAGMKALALALANSGQHSQKQ